MQNPDPDPTIPVPPPSSGGNHCPVCGLELPPQTPAEFCPRCLLGAGMRNAGVAHPTESETFGHYQLVRRLGAGGMGEVYEADDLETGRRVALKILGQRLDSPYARRRFLNEGRLAASINHPNSVYVFATEEIAGVPVIAMELMPGGTLEDKVRSQGPMPVADAVDAALQIIDGLAAAHSAGVLHRDIKPSNCFLDTDGSVKIGDYGLSISTKGHERAATSAGEVFMGTPAFASPEQLRGGDLSARSDIYSLGATLFYALTGRAPHEAGDTIRLLAKVLENPAPDLGDYCPVMPRRLANAVHRCLAKCPDDRFAGYRELRAAIAGFATRGKHAAELWQRLVAGTVDMAIIGAPLLAAARMVANAGYRGFAEFMIHAALLMPAMLAWIAWFTVLEWKWGKTPGKAWLGLEVRTTQPEQQAWMVFLRMLGRSALFVVLPMMLAFLFFPPLRDAGEEKIPVTHTFLGHRIEGTYTRHHYASGIGLPTFITWSCGVFLLFSGARRRNGWTALHDRLTGTHVVAAARNEIRSSGITVDLNDQVADAPALGPFHILEAMPGADDWWVGYDPKLLRKVWLRKVTHGTPPVPASLRNMRRPGRLRWLAGLRSVRENWDAYEFPGGQALVKFGQNRVSWRELRPWMSDLAAELSAAATDGTQPATACIDQVWINGEGRAKLLDFPAPGVKESPTSTGRSFWMELVDRVLDDQPLPLPVRVFLENLPNLDDPAMISRELDFLAAVPAEISRARRLGIIAAGAAGPLLLGLALFWMKSVSLPVSLFWALAALIAFVALPAMVAAAMVGDGLILRAMGVCVVDRRGNPSQGSLASRRSLIAWLPTLASPALYAGLEAWKGPNIAGAGTLAALGMCAAVSALLPERTLHDRLAGTWLVPR